MSRRLARQTALQTLYQLDVAKSDVQEALSHRLAEVELEQADREYTEFLVRDVIGSKEEIDTLLAEFSTDWKVERMNFVDRNIMRLAVCELINTSRDVPVKVCINEAVELAKRFSDEKAARFINGVLGGIADYYSLDDTK